MIADSIDYADFADGWLSPFEGGQNTVSRQQRTNRIQGDGVWFNFMT